MGRGNEGRTVSDDREVVICGSVPSLLIQSRITTSMCK
jgi:hypothetical protein